MTPAKTEPRRFKFRKNMDLGEIDAELDQRYLKDAFIDQGILEILEDTSNPKCIVVGRTGTGKTALLLKVEERRHRVIRVKPETLSMQFLSTTIVPNLAKLGVRLNFFYKLLWRHVLVVEVIRHAYDVTDEQKQREFFRRVGDFFHRDRRRKQRALEYIESWGSKFWEETHVRVEEIVSVLDQQLRTKLGTRYALLNGEAELGESESTSIRKEVQTLSQEVVNRVQLQDLDDALEALKEDALADDQKPYYIVIDDLDKEWVEAEYAYDLIDALIEEAGEFARIKNIKVIIALRENIVEELNQRSRGRRGRQREKHESLFLRLRWTHKELVELLDRRLEELVRGEYGGKLTTSDILSKSKSRGKPSAIEYMLERTFMRPRDLIRFMNICIEEAEDHAKITRSIIKKAERRYSRERRDSLVDEWEENYPGIDVLFDAFRDMKDGFKIKDVDPSRILHIIAEGETMPPASTPAVLARAGGTDQEIAEQVIKILYRVSFLGVKLTPVDPIVFSYTDPTLLNEGLRSESKMYFHPALYRSLGVGSPHLELN